MMGYVYIAAMIVLTTYGQVALKWQVGRFLGSSSEGLSLKNALQLLLNPWVISALAAAFIASIFWMMAMSRMPLSKAYPLTALSLPMIALLSVLVFNESFNAQKVLATALIMLGVVLISKPV